MKKSLKKINENPMIFKKITLLKIIYQLIFKSLAESLKYKRYYIKLKINELL